MTNRGGSSSSGKSSADGLRPAERPLACKQRNARPGSCMERETLAGDGKGMGASGYDREAESTDAPERGGLLRSSDEGPVMGLERRRRVTEVWAGQLETGKARCRRQAPANGGTSRLMREYQVRICERLGSKSAGLPGRGARKQAQRRAFEDQMLQLAQKMAPIKMRCNNIGSNSRSVKCPEKHTIADDPYPASVACVPFAGICCSAASSPLAGVLLSRCCRIIPPPASARIRPPDRPADPPCPRARYAGVARGPHA